MPAGWESFWREELAAARERAAVAAVEAGKRTAVEVAILEIVAPRLRDIRGTTKDTTRETTRETQGAARLRPRLRPRLRRRTATCERVTRAPWLSNSKAPMSLITDARNLCNVRLLK